MAGITSLHNLSSTFILGAASRHRHAPCNQPDTPYRSPHTPSPPQTTTYSKQLQIYEDKVMQKRLEEMTPIDLRDFLKKVYQENSADESVGLPGAG